MSCVVSIGHVLWTGLIMISLFCSTFNAEEAFATIGERMCVELEECLSKHAFSPFSSDRQSALKGQIAAVKCPDNPILKLIGVHMPLIFADKSVFFVFFVGKVMLNRLKNINTFNLA